MVTMENYFTIRYAHIPNRYRKIQRGGRLMKRLLIILCIVLFVTPCLANQIIIGKKKAAASCSVDTNEVGDRTDYSATGHFSFTNTYMGCVEATANCSGTLEYAFARHYGTASDKGKVCVFNRLSAAPPDSNDTLIGCGEITTSSNDWAQSAAKVGGAVTNGANYWICIIGG